MNVSGIRPNAMFYQYNSIKLNELRNQQIEQAKKAQLLMVNQEAKVETKPAISDEEMAAMQKEARERQTYDSFDYAKQYKFGEEYDLKGIDSDINSLDVEKAISAMQKDSVLQQYQYFVRDDKMLYPQAVDGNPAVRTGENFIL